MVSTRLLEIALYLRIDSGGLVLLSASLSIGCEALIIQNVAKRIVTDRSATWKCISQETKEAMAFLLRKSSRILNEGSPSINLFRNTTTCVILDFNGSGTVSFG
jgi:hypothetical protein